MNFKSNKAFVDIRRDLSKTDMKESTSNLKDTGGKAKSFVIVVKYLVTLKPFARTKRYYVKYVLK